MALYRVLRTAKATLTRTFYLDEVVTDASGDVGVVVTREDGTVVQQIPQITGPDADHGYSFTFAGSDVLDRLNLTWTATVGGDAIVLDQDVIEVVGGFLLSLGEARASDPVFQNRDRYPTADLIDRRNEVEDEFERICEQAFVPRFEREVLSGPRDRRAPLVLRWPRLRRVRAVSVAGAPYAQSVVDAYGADLLGLLRRDGGWSYGTGNVVVEYEHGMDRPPVGISRVAKTRLRSLLLTSKSPLPDRAERLFSETPMGMVRLAIPTADGTGIPEVDAELARHPSPRPRFG